MKKAVKWKKNTRSVFALIFCAVVILAGCSAKKQSMVEKYVSLGKEIRAADEQYGTQNDDYSEDDTLPRAYKFYRQPGHATVSKSVPYMTLLGEVSEGAVSAERSVTLDFTHKLYNYQYPVWDGFFLRPYNPMITDVWTLKNNTGSDLTVKAAYPFENYRTAAEVFKTNATLKVNGKPTDVSYAVAPCINYKYLSTPELAFDPGEVIKQKLENGKYLEEALSDDWKLEDEVAVYKVVFNEERVKNGAFYVTYDPKKTMLFDERGELTALDSSDPELLSYRVEGREVQVALIGEDAVSTGVMKLEGYEKLTLPDDAWTVERTTMPLWEYIEQSEEWEEYYEKIMPFEVWRQWNGYMVRQNIIDYFTKEAQITPEYLTIWTFDMQISPIVYYIAELTIPAGGEVEVEVSYMDLNCRFEFLYDKNAAYELGRTEISVIRNDTMIITEQNLGYETETMTVPYDPRWIPDPEVGSEYEIKKLINEENIAVFDKMEPGLYFEYREYWLEGVWYYNHEDLLEEYDKMKSDFMLY